MRKFYLYILLLGCYLTLCLSQGRAQPTNLVPNPSFEDTLKRGVGGTFWVKDWYMYLGSPDYFSSHYTDSYAVPKNYYGNQYPKEGKAYVAFIIKYIKDTINPREYIQIKLSQKLEKTQEYVVSFWVSLPDSFHLACSEKNIGFAFSDTLVKSNFEVLDHLSPIYFSEKKWDPGNKKQWEQIHCIIKATGNEKYLIIGNFLSDADTPLDHIGGGHMDVFKNYSYYYLDLVQLYKHEDLITETTIPNVFTPNNDLINDVWMPLFSSGADPHVQIFNRWGILIHEWKGRDGFWDGGDNAAGIYYYKLLFQKDGKEHKKSGTITLVR